jgi:hypothetical protein
VIEEHNAAVKIKAKVEHRLGEVLRETVDHDGVAGKAGPGRGKTGNSVLLVSDALPKPITKMQSSRAQQLAELPWQAIEQRIDLATEKRTRVRQPCG